MFKPKFRSLIPLLVVLLMLLCSNIICAPALSFNDSLSKLNSIEQQKFRNNHNSEELDNKLHEIRNSLENQRWESQGGERLLVSILITRTERLLGNFNKAEQELKCNSQIFKSLDQQARKEKTPNRSPLPYALYELGKIYQTRAELFSDDPETVLAYNVRALKQYYRILKDYPEHSLTVKSGAELMVCKSRLERLIESEITLPDITIPRQSNSIDELTPADINRMLENRQYSDALPLLEEVIKENQGNKRLAGTLLKTALVHAHLGQEEKCLKVALQMAQRYKGLPQIGEALAVCGRILWDMNKKETAIKLFAMLPDSAPAYPSAGSFALLAANTYLSQGNNDRALNISNKVSRNCEKYASKAYCFSADISLQQKQFKEAALYFKQAMKLETDPMQKHYIAFMMAQSLFKAEGKDNIDNSLTLLNTILAEKPTGDIKSKVLLLLAVINEKQGHSNKAIQYYKNYSKEFPEKPDQAEIYLRLCILYCQTDNTHEASKILKKLCSNYSHSDIATNARFVLAKSLFESGRSVQSTKYFNEFMNQSQIKPSQLLWITKNLVSHNKDIASAEIVLQSGKRLFSLETSSSYRSDPIMKSLRENPDTRKNIQFNLAMAAYIKKDFPLTLDNLEKVLTGSVSSRFYDAMILRAKTYIAMKKFDLARQDLSKSAIAALQNNHMEKYFQLQCLLGDTYIESGNYSKPYQTFRLLDNTSTPNPWREYALYKAALCATNLNRTEEFNALKRKYLQNYPQGQFVNKFDINHN